MFTKRSKLQWYQCQIKCQLSRLKQFQTAKIGQTAPEAGGCTKGTQGHTTQGGETGLRGPTVLKHDLTEVKPKRHNILWGCRMPSEKWRPQEGLLSASAGARNEQELKWETVAHCALPSFHVQQVRVQDKSCTWGVPLSSFNVHPGKSSNSGRRISHWNVKCCTTYKLRSIRWKRWARSKVEEDCCCC